MSLFANSIGSKTNFVRTDEPNNITAETIFEGEVIFSGEVTGLDITDISGLVLDLEGKALLTQLQTETDERVSSDISLNDAILLKANQSDLDTENQQRVSADSVLENNINFKLDEANSIFKAGFTKYVVDGRDNLQNVINSITNQGTVVFLSSGSISGSGLIIDKQNIALIAPITYPPSLEILQETTTAITADRIKFSNIQIDGVFNGGSSRSVYTQCDFMENVNILASQTAGYMTFNGCGFVSGKTINVANDFASVIYFIDCNFGGCGFSLNQASNQQVIFSNCAGFVSFPSNAFYAGINTLTTGYTQNTITKTILSSGSGTSGQVLTSGGASGIDSWTTPSGVCLESINVYCKGQTITTKYGRTVMIPNVSEVQNITSGLPIYTHIPASNISYLPPNGAKLVIYTLQTQLGGKNLENSPNITAQFKCFYGQFEIIPARVLICNNKTTAEYIELSVCINININGNYSIENEATVNVWDNIQTLTWKCSAQIGSGEINLHTNHGFVDGDPPMTNTFSPPKIKIEAFS